MNYEHNDGHGMPGRNENPYRPRTDSRRRPETGREPSGYPRKTGETDGTGNRTGTRREPVSRPRPVNRDTGPIRQTAAAREPEGRGFVRNEGAPRAGNPSRQTSSGGRTVSSSGARRLPGPGENPREMLAQARIERAKQKKRRRRIITMIVAECFTLMLIFGYAYFARRWNMIQREEFNPKNVQNEYLSVDDIKKMKGYRMIAVFGVDSRSTDVGAGNQSDVNIICCINEDTGEIRLVSVYRDTYLNVNDGNSYRKFNAAYANGGPEQALKALNKNLDLDITEYITFSWKAVADGINILNGVDIEITRSEFRFINGFITETVKATGIGSHQLTSPGMQHLDGVQAVAYGRLRLMDTDYARTERQRKIIEQAFAKAKQADFAALNNILVTILPSVSTNLTFADMTSMALNIGKYHIGETAGFPFAKGNANLPGKGDCVIAQTLESNVSQLHTFLFGDESYTPTDQVKEISRRIAADSGMHREGKPSTGSALATDSYAPEETRREETTEASTQPEEGRETDENGNPIEPETDENGNPMETEPMMTDEYGNLIDGPIEDWPEEPGIVYPGGTTGPGTVSPGSTNPEPSGSGRVPTDPGSESSESREVPGGPGVTPPGGETTPSGTGTLPSESGASHPAGTYPSGNVSPGGNQAGSSGPGTQGNGGSVIPGGTTDPGGSPGTTNPGESGGPGTDGQRSPNQGTQPETSGNFPGSSGDQGSGGGPGEVQGPGL